MGVDAAVQTQATRCVAGGYVWNPYFTQLADPLNVSGSSDHACYGNYYNSYNIQKVLRPDCNCLLEV